MTIADCGNRIPESFHAGTSRTLPSFLMIMGHHGSTESRPTESAFRVNLGAFFEELFPFLLQSRFDGFRFRIVLIFSHSSRTLHRVSILKTNLTKRRYKAPKRSSCPLCKPNKRGRDDKKSVSEVRTAVKHAEELREQGFTS